MKFDKQTIIALAVCMILMLAWPSICRRFGWAPAAQDKVTEETAGQAPAAETENKTADTDAGEKTPENSEKPAAEKAVAEVQSVIPDDCRFGNAYLDMTFSARTGAISKISFTKHGNNARTEPVAINDAGLFELIIARGHVSDITVTRNDDGSIESTRIITLPQGKLLLKQIFTVEKDYIINCSYALTNIGSKPLELNNSVVRGGSMAPWHTFSGDKFRTMSHRLDLMTGDGDLKDIDGDEDAEDYFFADPPMVKWASVSSKYFCSVLKSADGKDFRLWQEKPRKTVTDAREKEFNLLTIGAKLPEMKLQPGSTAEFTFSTYTGPKSGDALGAFAPKGNQVLHLAWGPLNYLARFLMWVLNLLFSICHSYGVSIIILTILVRAAFYPLTSKGNESMRKMQKVQPLFKELKEKYKDDPQLLNQKMTELYRKEGINPLAGCLPILLQIPIFFALYAMLDNAIALRHVSFLWAKNLAAADTVFSIPLGFTLPFANISAIPINPLVLMMTALMVVQQRMTPMSMDPAQKKMMVMMLVIMLLFLYDLPSGLTLYWTVSNIFSIIQLWLQQKRNRALQAAGNGQGK